MQGRLFTSPVMKKSEVQLWCQEVRENTGSILQREMELKTALQQLPANKRKAAS